MAQVLMAQVLDSIGPLRRYNDLAGRDVGSGGQPVGALPIATGGKAICGSSWICVPRPPISRS
jgi:hypothetical protein